MTLGYAGTASLKMAGAGGVRKTRSISLEVHYLKTLSTAQIIQRRDEDVHVTNVDCISKRGCSVSEDQMKQVSPFILETCQVTNQ